jgi:hypothetical protein
VTAHLVVRTDDAVLVDRATLAAPVGRSVHTIRARCPIAGHQVDDRGRRRALYDLDQCEATLAAVPLRRRTPPTPGPALTSQGTS